MADKPDNILQFLSDSSGFTGFTVEQRHAPPEPPHGHERDANGKLIEPKPTSDGWVSTVVENATGVVRGPFDFTGDAIAEMKRWAAEQSQTDTAAPTRVDILTEPTAIEGDDNNV